MTTKLPERQAPLQDAHIDTRDFRVRSITIISAAGVSQDVTNLIGEIQVRQDLHLGFMSGEMLVTEAIGLHNYMAFHGNEYLLVHINEPEQDQSINMVFRIYKISQRTFSNNNLQQYVVYFVSEELFKSNSKRISKSYRNQTISSIAADILKNDLGVAETRIIVSPTTASTNVVIPSYRPFEALHWLAARAHTDTEGCFVFYENLDGYNFRSLQSLYKSASPVKVPFTLESKLTAKQLDMDKYAIDVFESKRDFDSLMMASNGGYAMKLLRVNPVSRVIETNEYGLDKLPKMYSNPAASNHTDKDGALFKKSDAHQMCYLDADGIENWIQRVQALAALNNSLIEMVIPGSIRIQVGKTINLRVPVGATPSEGGQDAVDERNSGKYLVVGVNHKFDLINHRFETVLMVSRDSLPEALPTFDQTLPDKVAKMNRGANRG